MCVCRWWSQNGANKTRRLHWGGGIGLGVGSLAFLRELWGVRSFCPPALIQECEGPWSFSFTAECGGGGTATRQQAIYSTTVPIARWKDGDGDGVGIRQASQNDCCSAQCLLLRVSVPQNCYSVPQVVGRLAGGGGG